MMKDCAKPTGFTLAELLIALAILGVIAAFVIPKLLMAQQYEQNRAKAKEAAAMFVGAFQQAKLAGVVTANTKPKDLTPYMNYVAIVTSGDIDASPGGASRTCDTNAICLKLASGGMLWMQNWQFGGTSSLHTIETVFDPDPVVNTTSTANGPLKAVQFTLYYNGFLTTRGNTKPGSCNVWDCTGLEPNSALDPSWFSW